MEGETKWRRETVNSGLMERFEGVVCTKEEGGCSGTVV
jgi:hypothetical protein